MGLWEFLKKPLFGKGEKIVNDANTNASATMVMWGAGFPKRPEFNPRLFVDEGYRRNVVAFVCVNEIASSVAEPKLLARKRGGTDPLPDEHPLMTLLRQPHPDHSKFTFFELALVHLMSAGSCFIHKDRNATGAVVRLTLLRPDRMAAIPGRDGSIERYEYMVGDYSPQILPAEDVIRIPLPDPLDDYNGLPPVLVAAKFLDLDSAAAQYMRDFFVNGGVPAGLLKFTTPVRAEERARVQQEWQEMYGRGSKGRDQSNWHQIGVLTGDVTYEEIGTSPEKLRLEAIWGITETRICAAFRVPPQIVQTRIGMQFSTYSNYESAVKSFWSETLRPMYARFDEKLSSELASEFGEDLEIVFELDKVPALQISEDTQIERIIKKWESGLIRRNEAREMLGDKPLGEDYIMIPQGAVKCDEKGLALEAPGGGMLGPDGQPLEPEPVLDENGEPVLGPDGMPLMKPPPKALPFGQKALPPGVDPTDPEAVAKAKAKKKLPFPKKAGAAGGKPSFFHAAPHEWHR